MEYLDGDSLVSEVGIESSHASVHLVGSGRVVGADMGGGRNRRHALGGRRPGELTGFLDRPDPVVDGREDVRMEVNHGIPGLIVAPRGRYGRLVRRIAVALALLTLFAASASARVQVKGEDALSATLQWNDVKKLVSAGGPSYWPELPQFNTGLANDGAIAEVVSSYDYVGPDAERAGAQIVSTLIVHSSTAAAKSDYASAEKFDGGTTLSGPAVAADAARFSSKTDGRLLERTLRWRIGHALGRITLTDNAGYAAANWTPAQLAKLFAPVATRVHALLAGTLHAAPISASDSALLPTSAPGPILGTAAVPAQAWATVDSSKDPSGIYRELSSGGANTLVVRSYALNGASGNAVGITLFPFATSKAAASWVKKFPGKPPAGFKFTTLDHGNTGSDSTFISVNGGAFYELMFARGKNTIDVSCSAPFGKTSSACEAATRSLAEKWYAALPQ